MKTQTESIREHLIQNRTITPMEALNLFGCFRLAARISDLRESGMEIKTNMIHKGRKKFAEYIFKQP